MPAHRGRGIADALYKTAEQLCATGTLYNWVHPNNDCMIAFLAKRGYDTLNLIEIRKKHADEKQHEKIRIKNNEFKY